MPYSLILNLFFFPIQNGLDTKVEKSRKQMKERKNRAKKVRGVKKVIKMFLFYCSFLNLICLLFVTAINCCDFVCMQTKAGDAAKKK